MNVMEREGEAGLPKAEASTSQRKEIEAMGSKLLRVKDGAAKVIAGTAANSDGFYYIYYIGFVLPDDTTCRLSEFYTNPLAAKEALAAGEYTRTVEAVTYPNGTKLYYPAE